MKIGKLLPAVLALAFLLTGIWLYGNVYFPLGDAMPDETWTKAKLWYYDEAFHSREIEIDEVTFSKLVPVLESERVSHRQAFAGMSQPYFQLYLYHDTGYPTVFYIVENGDIAVAAELDADRYRHFDGGEELYACLRILTKNLPAAFSTKE